MVQSGWSKKSEKNFETPEKTSEKRLKKSERSEMSPPERARQMHRMATPVMGHDRITILPYLAPVASVVS